MVRLARVRMPADALPVVVLAGVAGGDAVRGAGGIVDARAPASRIETAAFSNFMNSVNEKGYYIAPNSMFYFFTDLRSIVTVVIASAAKSDIQTVVIASAKKSEAHVVEIPS